MTYLDAIMDDNNIVIFNTTPDRILEICDDMMEDARYIYTVNRGENLRNYSVKEYLEFYGR